MVGTQTVADFTLGLSAVQETITVTTDEPVVDTVSSALGTVIEQKQMAELPLIDRSYSKLIVLAPGANEIPASTTGGQFAQFFGRQPQYAGRMPADFRPFNAAKLIPAGTDIAVNVHYTPNGKPLTDRVQIGFTLAKTTPKRRYLALSTTSPSDSIGGISRRTASSSMTSS